MTVWTIFKDGDAEWDDLVAQLGGTSPFATAGWAQTKVLGRWTTARAVLADDGEIVAAAQVFWMTIFRAFSIGWIPGGIATKGAPDVAGFSTWFGGLAKTRFTYVRSAFHRAHCVADEELLIARGWSVSPSFVGARETFIVGKLTDRLADPSRLTPNWKRNLERGLKRNHDVSVCLTPDVSEINGLMREMVEFKKAKGPQDAMTEESLRRICAAMHNRLIVVQVRDSQGRIQAVRGAFLVKDHAWDAIAAAGIDARKNYASYVCAWKLMEELDDRGVTSYDLAGIDEVRNEGVFNFKKGMGGARTTYLGEWDWASSPIALHLARVIISRLG